MSLSAQNLLDTCIPASITNHIHTDVDTARLHIWVPRYYGESRDVPSIDQRSYISKKNVSSQLTCQIAFQWHIQIPMHGGKVDGRCGSVCQPMPWNVDSMLICAVHVVTLSFWSNSIMLYFDLTFRSPQSATNHENISSKVVLQQAMKKWKLSLCYSKAVIFLSY